ncbi:ty3-gypsy retrotransposon protein [Salix suchowensis]|nr:ty3-gypsy retrotransposon protein [Salix suchowensis]
MSVMMTETTSLEDQVANLTKLVEGLSTSLKTKDREIAKLMNKLESLNKRDLLKMPLSYQPPKFQQFDGKGNPRQHIAHFVETCNNAGTNGDLMVKQLFVP